MPGWRRRPRWSRSKCAGTSRRRARWRERGPSSARSRASVPAVHSRRTATPRRSESRRERKGLMKFDLHMHTTRHSPDSFMDPQVMLQRAREIGLHGVVITEHDWLWTEAELDELRAAAPGLVVLAGVEVSTRQGHFLAYGVRNPFSIPRNIGVADLCY